MTYEQKHVKHLDPVSKGKTIALHFLISASTGWNAVVMAGAGAAILDHVREGNTLPTSNQLKGARVADP